MSNTYFRYLKNISKGVRDRKQISITAEENPELGITLDICTVRGNGDEINSAHITLTEKEQDELICGLLERRGIIVNVVNPKWSFLDTSNLAMLPMDAKMLQNQSFTLLNDTEIMSNTHFKKNKFMVFHRK